MRKNLCRHAGWDRRGQLGQFRRNRQFVGRELAKKYLQSPDRLVGNRLELSDLRHGSSEVGTSQAHVQRREDALLKPCADLCHRRLMRGDGKLG